VASKSEVTFGVTIPVMQIITQVIELYGKPASLKVGSIGTSFVALRSTPTSVEPSKLLETFGCGGLGVEVLHSLPVGVEVVALDADVLGASAPIPVALFAKKRKFCYLLTSLEADDPASGKTIRCLLKERPIRNKSKKACSVSLKRKANKSDTLRMAYAAA
jgi:hypothetical protein